MLEKVRQTLEEHVVSLCHRRSLNPFAREEVQRVRFEIVSTWAGGRKVVLRRKSEAEATSHAKVSIRKS